MKRTILDRLFRVPTREAFHSLYLVVDVEDNHVLETITATTADEALDRSRHMGTDYPEALMFVLLGGQGVIVIRS